MSTQPADKVTIADIIIHGVQTALRTAVITSFLCFLLGIGVTLAGNLRLLHLGASQPWYPVIGLEYGFVLGLFIGVIQAWFSRLRKS